MVSGIAQQTDALDGGGAGSCFLTMQLLESLNIEGCERGIAVGVDGIDVRHHRSVGIDRRIDIPITGFMGVLESESMAQFVKGDAGPTRLARSSEG